MLGYLRDDTARTMQLATVQDGRPWVATVYFVVNDELNVYWLSWPERRHSRELAVHEQVAAAIVLKSDPPVVGVQVEGVAEQVDDPAQVRHIMGQYDAKYHQGGQFADIFAAGKNHHVLYRLIPHTYAIFDELRHKDKSPIYYRLPKT